LRAPSGQNVGRHKEGPSNQELKKIQENKIKRPFIFLAPSGQHVSKIKIDPTSSQRLIAMSRISLHYETPYSPSDCNAAAYFLLGLEAN